jgi:hypothetical protein
VTRHSAPTSSQAPAAPRRAPWWIAPAAVVGLVLVAWLVLAVLPLRRDEPRVAPRVPTETVAEAPVEPPQSGTLVEVPPGASDDSFEITTAAPPQQPPVSSAPPPNVTATAGTPSAPPVVVSTQPQPQRQPDPQRAPQSDPRPATPPVTRPRAEITAPEATGTLLQYVRSTRYYDVAGECIRVENNGYRNVGYDLEVWHSCPGSSGGSRLLGRWRVDARTRELFRRRDDGRYLKP